jgi:hypothetical protein
VWLIGQSLLAVKITTAFSDDRLVTLSIARKFLT